MTTITQYNLQYIHRKIGEIEFDGYMEYEGDYQPVLYYPIVHISLEGLDKEDYAQYEEAIEKASLTREKYDIFFSYDVSGYDYWSNQENDENYIQGIVTFQNTTMNQDDIKNLITDLEAAAEQLHLNLPLQLSYDPFYF